MNLVSEPLDVAILREAHRHVRRLFTAQAFNGSIPGPLYPASNVTTDEDLNEFITSAAGPYLHGGGTAGMSPQGATWGVVDPDYRVKGTSGLRIVDASIFVSTIFYGYSLCLIDNHLASWAQWSYTGSHICTRRACELNDCARVYIWWLGRGGSVTII